MTLTIEHKPADHRFEVVVDGVTCVLEYRLADRVMTITHTSVPEAVGGRGIAAELARTAFDTARAKGWKVVPACSYAEGYIAKHPEYADLVV